MVHYIAILLGVLTRTIVPYLVQLKKKPKLKWDNKYLISAFAGLILALILAYIVSMQMAPGLSPAGEFFAAFTLQDLSRNVQKSFE
ncbi:hypothetical protein KY338_06885 [Candidatus Woesearchaeota archaeon]|nr:hypothetical protein [Candidatus Woesearchaeota archaeon]MBW3006371.1 hypothetical protein [Candidatus Woesearchaeota archaeon]